MAQVKFSVSSILLILFFTLTLGSAIPQSQVSNSFKNQGFQYIGIISENVTESEGIASLSGTKTFSLWMSPRDALESQSGAISKCRELRGNLVHILNDIQFLEVRVALLVFGDGEYFWTSGNYDAAHDRFAWSSNNLPVNNRFIRSERGCSEKTPGFGLTVQGDLSSFGLCSSWSSSVLRYICRV